eukprot:scaffold15.g4333.t1
MLSDPAVALAINPAVAGAFLDAAIGTSSPATGVDPTAQTFVIGFMSLPRAAFLAALAAAPAPAPALGAALGTLSALQWSALQNYVVGIIPTWGRTVYSQMLAGGGGGLVVTKTVFEFLHDTGNPATAFYPQVQQKKMLTDKAAGDPTQVLQEYRGLPFSRRPTGNLNASAPNEGIVMGVNYTPKNPAYSYDSLMSRIMYSATTGELVRINDKFEAYNMVMTVDSARGCNASYAADWAAVAGFNATAFNEAMAPIDALYSTSNATLAAQYWEAMQEDAGARGGGEAGRRHGGGGRRARGGGAVAAGGGPGEAARAVLLGRLNGTALGSLGRYFGDRDVRRERCIAGEAHDAGWWAMGRTGRARGAGAGTGSEGGGAHPPPRRRGLLLSGQTWNADAEAHEWRFAIEPFTGMSVEARKTAQYVHLVARSDQMYPNLWVAQAAQPPPAPSALTLSPWAPFKRVANAILLIRVLKDMWFWLCCTVLPCVGTVMQIWPQVYRLFSRRAEWQGAGGERRGRGRARGASAASAPEAGQGQLGGEQWGHRRGRCTASRRRRELAWSRTRRARLPRAELAMVAALLDAQRSGGEGGGGLPGEVSEDADDSEEEEEAHALGLAARLWASLRGLLPRHRGDALVAAEGGRGDGALAQAYSAAVAEKVGGRAGGDAEPESPWLRAVGAKAAAAAPVPEADDTEIQVWRGFEGGGPKGGGSGMHVRLKRGGRLEDGDPCAYVIARRLCFFKISIRSTYAFMHSWGRGGGDVAAVTVVGMTLLPEDTPLSDEAAAPLSDKAAARGVCGAGAGFASNFLCRRTTSSQQEQS